MDVVRWGIIGCGDVTEVKSGPGLQQARGSALVAVMRRNGEKAKDYAARHGVAKWTDDADAIIHDPEVDAVYIATLPDSHATYTKRVAAAGKAVYVEKPWRAPTLNVATCLMRATRQVCRSLLPTTAGDYRNLSISRNYLRRGQLEPCAL